jgi:hypothetical protein
MFVPVPSKELDLHRHMLWSFYKVRVLALSVAYHEFDPLLGQTKHYKIDIY